MSFHSFIERLKAYGIKAENRRKITAQQMYPWAIEREFQQQLQNEFRKAGAFFEQQALKNTWSYESSVIYTSAWPFNDNMDDLSTALYDNTATIRPLAKKVSYEVEAFQQRCFENYTDTVIGARYIPPVVSSTITDTWEKNFMTLCTSSNDEMKKKISSIVSDAVMNGNNIADTRKQIQNLVGTFSKSKANLIARTETAKLNMAISKAQMEECGVEYYEWACMLDERSRKSHVAMDGRICIWSDPTKYYDIKTHKVKARPQSAVHLHPGDDYNCRCVALPWDPLIETEINQKKGKPNKQWLELKEQEKQKQQELREQRIRVKNIPFFGEKLSHLIKENSATIEYYSAISFTGKETAVTLDNIRSTNLNSTATEKISALQKDIAVPAMNNGWYRSEYGNLELRIDDTLPANASASTSGTHTILLKTETANRLFDAFRKIATGKTSSLTLNDSDSIFTLWHELNHLQDKIKKIDSEFIPLQRKFLEAANEYMTFHSINNFLRPFGILTKNTSRIFHSEKLYALTEYGIYVKKLETLVKHYGIDDYDFAEILRKTVNKYNPNSRDFAIKDAFDSLKKNPYLGTALNDIIDMIIDDNVSIADFYNYIIR